MVNVTYDKIIGFVQYKNSKKAPDVRLFRGNCLLVNIRWGKKTADLWNFLADEKHLNNCDKADVMYDYFTYYDYDSNPDKVTKVYPIAVWLNTNMYNEHQISLITRIFARNDIPLRWFSADYITRADYKQKRKEIINNVH